MQLFINHTSKFIYCLEDIAYTLSEAIEIINKDISKLFSVSKFDKIELYNAEEVIVTYTQKLCNKGYICSYNTPLCYFMKNDSDSE